MSGYNPGEANVSKFGLPKVWEIMNEEVTDSYFEVPAGRRVAEIIAKSAMFLEDYLYPFAEIGGIPIGDAHWVVLKASPMGKKNKPKITLSRLVEIIKERKVKKTRSARRQICSLGYCKGGGRLGRGDCYKRHRPLYRIRHQDDTLGEPER
jgi:hypothetical protein